MNACHKNKIPDVCDTEANRAYQDRRDCQRGPPAGLRPGTEITVGCEYECHLDWCDTRIRTPR